MVGNHRQSRKLARNLVLGAGILALFNSRSLPRRTLRPARSAAVVVALVVGVAVAFLGLVVVVLMAGLILAMLKSGARSTRTRGRRW